MSEFSQASPEALGIPSGALRALLLRLGTLEYLNSIMVLRHGQLCLECYVAPYSPTVPHQLFSLSKSFTSCAVGLARREKRLTLDDRLLDFFPEYRACVTDARMAQVTLRDLLTMRSGHLACPTQYFWNSRDWAETFLASQLGTEPGTHFVYNSGASYMLAAVIRKVTGENVREYLMKRLFEPLAIAPGIWECCPRGVNCGGWGLSLTTRDVAKFAQLLLQNGVWQGREILPADYLAEASAPHADNSMNQTPDWQQGYGYHFWKSQHGYRGDGAAGQYALMLPEEDMAVAITSCVGNMQNILTAIWEELLPHLADQPLAPDPAAERELRKVADAMRIPPTPGDRTCRGESVRWEFEENEQGVKSCEVAFGTNDCTLTFDGPHGVEQLRAGFGFHAHSVFQLTDRRPHPVAASAAWCDDHTLEIRTFITDGIYRDCWTVDFRDAAEPLKNQVLCACFRVPKPAFVLKK